MERLFIEATKSTPEIEFDPLQNHITIRGESYPENAFAFYKPLFKWIKGYLEGVCDEAIRVDFALEYLNTSSTKSIMLLLDILEEAYSKGKQINIFWHYDEENELALEIAEDFMESLNIPFELKKKGQSLDVL